MIRLALFILFASSTFAFAQEATVFSVTSLAFNNEGDIPAKYTCKGGDINPPLDFNNIPAKTKSLALTIHSPDAPEGTWVHWVVYNISPEKKSIPENSIPGYQSLNDFGKYNYAGPCPVDEKQHTYIFKAYALNDILNINEGMTKKDLEHVMRGKIIAQSELKAYYRNPIW